MSSQTQSLTILIEQKHEYPGINKVLVSLFSSLFNSFGEPLSRADV